MIAFGQEIGEWRHIAIALDQSRLCTDPGNKAFIQAPDVLADRLIMAVDEQRSFGIDGMAGEMDFPDLGRGNRVEPGNRIVPKIVGTYGDVVDVDQQPAAGPSR